MPGPWDTPDDASTLLAYDEFRRYRELNRAYRRSVKRQRLRRQVGWPALAAVAAVVVAWAFLTFKPLQWLPSSVTVWRGSQTTFQSRYYRNCAEARAAGVAPILMGQPGYSRWLDADHDGIACELSFMQWVESWFR